MKTEPNDNASPVQKWKFITEPGKKDAECKIITTGGLTKREYFAGLAMQGLTAHAKAETYTSIAEGSVKMADTLIEALNK